MKKTVKKAALAKKAAHTKKSVAKAKIATKAKTVAAKAKSKVMKTKPKAKVAPVAKPVVKKTILTKVTGHLKHAKPIHAAPAPVVKPVTVAAKPVTAACCGSCQARRCRSSRSAKETRLQNWRTGGLSRPWRWQDHGH